MSFLESLPDDVHDRCPGVDDEVALPGLEQLRPVPHLVKPLEGGKRLSRARYK